MTEKKVINPGWQKYMNHPALTYVPAVQKGNMLFISGLTGVNPETGELVGKDDMEAQTRQIYRNLADILKAAGATFDNIVQTTDYITTRENYGKTGKVRREFFGKSLPASVGFIVKDLLRENAMIEVSAIAVLD